MRGPLDQEAGGRPDYAALLADTEFYNLLDYRLQVLLQNHIPTFEKLIPEIDRVLLEIEAELDA